MFINESNFENATGVSLSTIVPDAEKDFVAKAISLAETDNGMIVIPVLFNNIDSPIITYPKYFNFGLCQVSAKSKYNFKKIIPLTLYNKGIENIKIGKVYLGYENIFIQFHQNFNGNNIIMAPNEEIKYGHLIFDGNVMKKMEKRKKKLVGKLQKGSIYIETNSTDCPFIQVNYSYFADMGEIEQIVSGNIQQLPKQINNFNFMVNVKYNHPYGLEIMSNYNNTKKNSYYYRFNLLKKKKKLFFFFVI